MAAGPSYINFGGGGGGSNPIFVVLGIIVIIALAYWVFKSGLLNKKGIIAPAGAPCAKLYADAPEPHECTNVVEGGLEQGGDRKEPRIEGCGFNFLNQEVTAYINYHDIDDTFSVKLRGPRHSGDGPCVCNNIHYFNLGSKSENAFGKQAEHTGEYCSFGPTAPTLPQNQLVGVKCIEWNEGSGVHFQSWTDTGNGWELVADEIDNGSPGDCSGPAAPAFTTSPCVDPSCPEVSTDFRIDGISGGGDVEFSNLSVREIAVPEVALTTEPADCTPAAGGGGGGTTTPPPPPANGNGDGDGDGDGEPDCDEENPDSCTCPGGGTVPLAASEDCDDCATKCGSGGGMAALVRRAMERRRRSNQARRTFHSYLAKRHYSFTSRVVKISV